ncbi:hypothetical protein COW36_04430 [bacterium (Candidatus Blackallbacteria) CG17_big_fil_post_rev_8_21_14_2_50_48_46]|uniref:site-specific DNA-methyltransferase (adenine-specific) n=1 Tax=bacterium (Candidatus Blackallbacteria) CG17_big_fil_post_rev_8_21_14_2_50_48_46 TaxID=2014261 RepID=A0A2M7G8X2_9BACT|nr:MAG: hypothetical protein COW64_04515 [bacterium (Candidatus Blackallbacteria) CG18_big_fil_WC_8_21_14_2_50_49_26]PIW18545.1 MAG: hypothetical protein COW36_04430 [bacterium (Candidatus Blackallbacteria) CG17_big_fil_post_rev_8_21_14_2_50_48_46]PIW46470.1 MAG: hypothetical protein COW20_16250 [bacterium (Candidatus Blackallbacteria) CG13_big_fil_rev_8_21_14_2_50_49_14]
MVNWPEKICALFLEKALAFITEFEAQALLLQLLFLKDSGLSPISWASFESQLNQARGTPLHLPENLPPPSNLFLHWQKLPENFLKDFQAEWHVWEQQQSGFQPIENWIGSFSELINNKTQRRKAGVFYTPRPVVRFLCRETLSTFLKRHQNLSPKTSEALLKAQTLSLDKTQKQALVSALKELKICDPACGGGYLLLGMLAELKSLEKQLLPNHSDYNWSQNIYGIDIDPLAVSVTRWRIWKASKTSAQSAENCKLQIVIGDTLAEGSPWGKDIRFDLWVANPPYLGEKGHQKSFEALKKGSLKGFYQARSDLSYYFFHRVLDWSKPGAIAGFLTTSYLLTSSQGQKLRGDLKERAIIHKITDFHELRLFSGALGQHNLVTVFERGYAPELPVSLNLCIRKGQFKEAALDNLLNQTTSAFIRREMRQDEIFRGPELSMAQPVRLQILDTTLEGILEKIRKQPTRLEDFAQLHQGLVSGADRLTLGHCKKFGIKQPPGSGIFVLDQKKIHSWPIKEHERQLLRPWFKNSDIEPWTAQTQSKNLIIYTDRQALLTPQDRLYQHLEDYYPILAARREVQLGRMPWWQLHWPRQASIFEGPKLVLPQRSQTALAAWNETPWYASADVYFITAQAADNILPWLLAWLNSPLAWLWLSCEGKRKGKLLELYHRPLAQMPVLRPKNEYAAFKSLLAELKAGKRPSLKLEKTLQQIFYAQLKLSQTEQSQLEAAWKNKAV